MPDRFRYQLRCPLDEPGLHVPPGEYEGHVEPEFPPRLTPRVRLFVPGDPPRSIVTLGRNVVRLGPVAT